LLFLFAKYCREEAEVRIPSGQAYVLDLCLVAVQRAALLSSASSAANFCAMQIFKSITMMLGREGQSDPEELPTTVLAKVLVGRSSIPLDSKYPSTTIYAIFGCEHM
jgi:hypothetical protein